MGIIAHLPEKCKFSAQNFTLLTNIIGKDII